MNAKRFYINKFLNKGFIAILLGILVWSWVGCEQPPPPPQPPAKVERTAPPPPTEKDQKPEEGAEEQKEPEYWYDPAGRREPFKTLIAEELPKVVDIIATPNPEIIKTPLQKFNVNQLKLTGIILGGLGDYARVVAPDGKSYTINVGTLVGPNEGEVIAISDNVVLVKETIRYLSGNVEEVETPMYLNPIEEGEKP